MASRNRRRREQMLSLCHEVGPEDGVDPRTFFHDSRSKRSDHKLARLCGQVARTLALVFPGPDDDEALRECAVVSVEAAGGEASRLLVTIGPARPGATLDPGAILGRLERIRGRLRTEVAAALERKCAPTLVFQVRASESSEEADVGA